ncbi:U3 small nucleolar RNA-associated protein 7 [Seminavis robusta]|uniref:U3 small nucleolar RNA-associated protein 7 n=1 Tax=Seminavis robusta TaxID=568900 RepID=A0A9N8E879_9STRA|nr:U3 small nucleolar RNA-associated protein 7 [Seminavis robusta]|eukprot:Sro791_g202910.1 U3 small nucleolar RNA-associated protein 7 (661) ;mRNA; r:5122-7104
MGKKRRSKQEQQQESLTPKNEEAKDGNDNNDDPPKSNERPTVSDPDGTHDIHRGFTNKEARARRHELIQTLQEKTEKKNKKKNQKDNNANNDNNNHDLAQSLKEQQNNDETNNNKKKRARLAHDKILETRLESKETKLLQAKIAAMDAADILHTGTVGMVQAETDMERTTGLSQVELKRQLLQDNNDEDDNSDNAARHIYDLTMESPHGLKYDRSGRYALLYSNASNPQGHVAIMDCHTRSLVNSSQGEFYIQQSIRDACFLHQARLLATAAVNQPVAIYDDRGAEIHSLSDHKDAVALEFLPYHFLLAAIDDRGPALLRYIDITTGQLVSKHRTRGDPSGSREGLRAGNPVVLRQNPSNAVLHCGHTNGTVTLWSPASQKYLVKFLCHKGAAITSLAVDMGGNVMVTGGADRQVKVWDLRNTYRHVHSYFTVAGPPTSLDISQQGMLGIGHAGHATIWAPSALQVKAKDPYMHHLIPRGGPIETLRFRPYEDVCGIGHAKGMSSIVIPGSGEPNLDTAEYFTNPFSDSKQRREAEVRALLDKLSPDMIALDPNVIGGMEELDPHKRLEQIRDQQEAANNMTNNKKKKEKTKKRGRSKIQTKLRRKQRNIVDQQTMQLREAREQEKTQEDAERKAAKGEIVVPTETPKEQAPTALKRFFS